MGAVNTTFMSRRRAMSLSSAVMFTLFFGLSSMAAQAADVTIEGTVAECDLSITTPGPLDLGEPSFDYDDNWVDFGSTIDGDFLYVAWGSEANDCVGSLYAERNDIVRDGIEPIAEAFLMLEGFSITSTPEVVAESSFRPLSGSIEFDVEMSIPTSAGPGTYSTILTFTVGFDG